MNKEHFAVSIQLFQECSFILASLPPLPLLPRCPLLHTQVPLWPPGLCESARPAPCCFPNPELLPCCTCCTVWAPDIVGPHFVSFILPLFPIHCCPPTKRQGLQTYTVRKNVYFNFFHACIQFPMMWFLRHGKPRQNEWSHKKIRLFSV